MSHRSQVVCVIGALAFCGLLGSWWAIHIQDRVRKIEQAVGLYRNTSEVDLLGSFKETDSHDFVFHAKHSEYQFPVTWKCTIPSIVPTNARILGIINWNTETIDVWHVKAIDY